MVVTTTTADTAPDDATCKDGAKLFRDDANEIVGCYKSFSRALTWTQAKALCEQATGFAGELAPARSEAEQSFLLGIAPREFWIGANSLEADGIWRWAGLSMAVAFDAAWVNVESRDWNERQNQVIRVVEDRDTGNVTWYYATPNLETFPVVCRKQACGPNEDIVGGICSPNAPTVSSSSGPRAWIAAAVLIPLIVVAAAGIVMYAYKYNPDLYDRIVDAVCCRTCTCAWLDDTGADPHTHVEELMIENEKLRSQLASARASSQWNGNGLELAGNGSRPESRTSMGSFKPASLGLAPGMMMANSNVLNNNNNSNNNAIGSHDDIGGGSLIHSNGAVMSPLSSPRKGSGVASGAAVVPFEKIAEASETSHQQLTAAANSSDANGFNSNTDDNNTVDNNNSNNNNNNSTGHAFATTPGGGVGGTALGPKRSFGDRLKDSRRAPNARIRIRPLNTANTSTSTTGGGGGAVDGTKNNAGSTSGNNSSDNDSSNGTTNASRGVRVPVVRGGLPPRRVPSVAGAVGRIALPNRLPNNRTGNSSGGSGGGGVVLPARTVPSRTRVTAPLPVVTANRGEVVSRSGAHATVDEEKKEKVEDEGKEEEGKGDNDRKQMADEDGQGSRVAVQSQPTSSRKAGSNSGDESGDEGDKKSVEQEQQEEEKEEEDVGGADDEENGSRGGDGDDDDDDGDDDDGGGDGVEEIHLDQPQRRRSSTGIRAKLPNLRKLSAVVTPAPTSDVSSVTPIQTSYGGHWL
ncbi:hypothetical protein PTSG_10568 [Salpingoeca rosetta]|uniref:C-type lectin domain-containing protein n=1 Tax=Salpingoeca rosetta (strain ATCC 50818 / BSB-021) TaxID=946362 RepID=F2URQ8_SALR5|nr:uncharacterized protein PTSG_10568 [Salpingoeca rosetta]EGD80313.1 hypothetical protein PTSG_10568 [Salpingoeca rosetta]|eukprot:XP_004988103.1 hypothetical protein PTSG_10568 [Salpingoeca rosetta]